jgi:hypothetical protein
MHNFDFTGSIKLKNLVPLFRILKGSHPQLLDSIRFVRAFLIPPKILLCVNYM